MYKKSPTKKINSYRDKLSYRKKNKSRRDKVSRRKKSRKYSQKIKYLKGKGMMYMLSGTGNCSNKSYKDCLSCTKSNKSSFSLWENRSCIFDYKKQSCRANKR